jgi:hypothetical protein
MSVSDNLLCVRLVVISLMCSLALVSSARAADDHNAAKALYVSATRHFDLAEYEAALADFRAAYRTVDDPVLLYNIAQCYRLLNQNEEAIKFYKTYLRRSPNARNRAEVESKIRALADATNSQQIAHSMPSQKTLPPGGDTEPNRTTTTTPTTSTTTTTPTTSTSDSTSSRVDLTVTKAPPPRTPVYKRWWLWTIVGVVVVGAGVGLGVGLTVGSHSPQTNFPLVTF